MILTLKAPDPTSITPHIAICWGEEDRCWGDEGRRVAVASMLYYWVRGVDKIFLGPIKREDIKEKKNRSTGKEKRLPIPDAPRLKLKLPALSDDMIYV